MPRITVDDLPDAVRARLDEVLGAPVVEHVSHPGGFSPGTADKVTSADGTVAFVKAVHADLNPDSPGIHRAEARVMAALPDTIPVPRWIDGFELDGWVVLVEEYVPARHPVLPWTAATFAPVLDATLALADRLTPAPLPDLRTASEQARRMGNGWASLAGAPPADLDPWIAARLDELAARVERSLAALDGDTLCHWDLRADNILLRDDGEVVFIDWPWALRGARWLDAVLLTSEFAVEGGTPAETDAYLRLIAGHTNADPAAFVGALAWVAGFLTHRSRTPAPPGLPTLRAFQRRWADGLTAWLRGTELA